MLYNKKAHVLKCKGCKPIFGGRCIVILRVYPTWGISLGVGISWSLRCLI